MPRGTSTQRTETIDVNGLQVTVIRKSVKNLNLRVLDDGSVRVSVSPRVSMERVVRYVDSKRDWIERARQRMLEKVDIGERHCAEGATVYLWGRPLTCHIVDASTSMPARTCSFAVEGDRLVTRCGARAAYDDSAGMDLRDRMLERWLVDTFRDAAEQLLSPCEGLVGKRCSTIRLRRMKTRWGSCNTRTAAVTLNTELVHYPQECLRYVIIHELCHLYVPNHGPRFHELMDRFCPSWREIRARLNRR